MNTDIDLCGISQRNWDAFSTNTGSSEELAADPITSSSSQNKPEIGKRRREEERSMWKTTHLLYNGNIQPQGDG